MKRFLDILFVLLALTNVSCSTKKSTQSAEVTQTNFLQAEETKLNPPFVDLDSIFFNNTAEVVLDFRLEAAAILYQIDDGPMQKYDSTIKLNESCKIKAKTIKPGYEDSDLIELRFLKINRILEDAVLTTTPTPSNNYPGTGTTTLIDNRKGSMNFREGSDWCGFQDKIVNINIELDKPTEINTVYVSLLSDQASWIFNPSAIEILIDDKSIKEESWELPREGEQAGFNIVPISFSPIKTKSLQVRIKNMKEIPIWHPGKGTPPWLFIDEIIVQ